MIVSSIVGVNDPASGVAELVETGVAAAVALGVGVGVGVGLLVGVADGVDSKAGPSAADTTKFLVSSRSTPLSSRQDTVILCDPSSNPSGGLQLQFPSEFTVRACVIGELDSIVTVMSVPGGPSPRNSGVIVVMISPSPTLSKVTVSADEVAI